MEQTVEAAFTTFVAERSHALIRVAYTLTGDQRAAEDLVQGALAKAYSHWSRIHGDAEPYVRRIIYNDKVSGWRRQARQRELPMADVPEVAESRDHDHDTALRLVLRQALLSLPPRQRAVLVLRYLEDRSVEETAEVLGCRPGTVASQASRALGKLRELVPELGSADEAAEVLR
ncbi:SigE family RNA polymerase sigma factor [Actinoplanes friuliensis]|uniref:Putative RNA polymerase ECF-subfamily sigma factor n=1 Tax=Actinoplanes friuliensis DSM 7358 TaxID=1246995 RepID=U5WCX6_9ACTN|nr:SigE family RNA polymerase sigma factor [Actinoplanes friuliensis]AGZ46832.1 putative RNA polymerase ECF-subfamily sigma factor [Actinoplanes friuliensis DSM 7358]